MTLCIGSWDRDSSTGTWRVIDLPGQKRSHLCHWQHERKKEDSDKQVVLGAQNQQCCQNGGKNSKRNVRNGQAGQERHCRKRKRAENSAVGEREDEEGKRSINDSIILQGMRSIQKLCFGLAAVSRMPETQEITSGKR